MNDKEFAELMKRIDKPSKTLHIRDLNILVGLAEIGQSMQWISVKNRLPENKQKVLIYYPNDRYFFNGKSDCISAAWFIKGKTREEADKLGSYSAEDQFGNNLVPYYWEGDGPMAWFGQDVTHWMPIESPEDAKK